MTAPNPRAVLLAQIAAYNRTHTVKPRTLRNVA